MRIGLWSKHTVPLRNTCTCARVQIAYVLPACAGHKVQYFPWCCFWAEPLIAKIIVLIYRPPVTNRGGNVRARFKCSAPDRRQVVWARGTTDRAVKHRVQFFHLWHKFVFRLLAKHAMIRKYCRTYGSTWVTRASGLRSTESPPTSPSLGSAPDKAFRSFLQAR